MGIYKDFTDKLVHSGKFRRWIKLIHLVSAALWGGGSTAVVIIATKLHPINYSQLYIKYECLFLIDIFVIGSGAVGCLLTGLLYSIYTTFGFFKHWWITLKWLLLSFYVVAGTLWFMPWVARSMEEVKDLPPLSPVMGESQRTVILHNTLIVLHLVLVITIMILSVKKPFGKIKKHHQNSPQSGD